MASVNIHGTGKNEKKARGSVCLKCWQNLVLLHLASINMGGTGNTKMIAEQTALVLSGVRAWGWQSQSRSTSLGVAGVEVEVLYYRTRKEGVAIIQRLIAIKDE